MRLNNTV